jgi:hypothetical protein
MTTHHHPLRTAAVLSLAVGALVPAAAQARFDPTGSASAGPPSPSRTSAPVVSPAPGGFDWGDAGIGAAGGVGLAMVGVGGSFVVAGRRRRYSTAR